MKKHKFKINDMIIWYGTYGKKTVDIYPTNRRYCILGFCGGEWGTYENIMDIIKFLK